MYATTRHGFPQRKRMKPGVPAPGFIIVGHLHRRSTAVFAEQVFQTPQPIRHPGFHRRRDFQAAVNPAEVVEERVQRHRGPEVAASASAGTFAITR